MISAWWLCLIIPVSFLAGLSFMALVAGGSAEDDYQEGYLDGIRHKK